MKPSASLLFPFKENEGEHSLERTYTVAETLISSMKVFFCTRKGSRLGSRFGSIVADLPMQLYSTSNVSQLNKEIKKEVSDQFPGVNFLSVYLVQDEITPTLVYLKINFQINGEIKEFSLTLPNK